MFGWCRSDSLLIDLLEEVFEASVIALQDGVLCTAVKGHRHINTQHSTPHRISYPHHIPSHPTSSYLTPPHPSPPQPEVEWHLPVQSVLEAAVSEVTDGLEEMAQHGTQSMRQPVTVVVDSPLSTGLPCQCCTLPCQLRPHP